MRETLHTMAARMETHLENIYKDVQEIKSDMKGHFKDDQAEFIAIKKNFNTEISSVRKELHGFYKHTAIGMAISLVIGWFAKGFAG